MTPVLQLRWDTPSTELSQGHYVWENYPILPDQIAGNSSGQLAHFGALVNPQLCKQTHDEHTDSAAFALVMHQASSALCPVSSRDRGKGIIQEGHDSWLFCGPELQGQESASFGIQMWDRVSIHFPTIRNKLDLVKLHRHQKCGMSPWGVSLNVRPFSLSWWVCWRLLCCFQAKVHSGQFPVGHRAKTKEQLCAFLLASSLIGRWIDPWLNSTQLSIFPIPTITHFHNVSELDGGNSSQWSCSTFLCDVRDHPISVCGSLVQDIFTGIGQSPEWMATNSDGQQVTNVKGSGL